MNILVHPITAKSKTAFFILHNKWWVVLTCGIKHTTHIQGYKDTYKKDNWPFCFTIFSSTRLISICSQSKRKKRFCVTSMQAYTWCDACGTVCTQKQIQNHEPSIPEPPTHTHTQNEIAISCFFRKLRKLSFRTSQTASINFHTGFRRYLSFATFFSPPTNSNQHKTNLVNWWGCQHNSCP